MRWSMETPQAGPAHYWELEGIEMELEGIEMWSWKRSQRRKKKEGTRGRGAANTLTQGLGVRTPGLVSWLLHIYR